MFSGGAGWAEIQRRCLCVGASAKHNKTLWGMNQTQSDRDTKAHMLIHSVNFTISLPFSPSVFFTLSVFLSYFPINWPLYYWLPWLAYHYVFWLCRSVEFLDSRHVHGVSQVSRQTSTNRTHSSLFIRILLCVHAHMRVSARASLCVLRTQHGMNGQAHPVPALPCFPSLSHLFCLFNFLSSTVLLLSCSVVERVRQ